MADINNKEVIFVSAKYFIPVSERKILVVSLEGVKAFYEGQGQIDTC